QNDLAPTGQHAVAETFKTLALTGNADTTQLHIALTATDLGIDITDPPAPELLWLVIDTAHIAARDFIITAAKAGLSLEVSFQNKAVKSDSTIQRHVRIVDPAAAVEFGN